MMAGLASCNSKHVRPQQLGSELLDHVRRSPPIIDCKGFLVGEACQSLQLEGQLLLVTAWPRKQANQVLCYLRSRRQVSVAIFSQSSRLLLCDTHWHESA